MPEPSTAASLRIFLSYGHDSNEGLVLRIYADLKKRGHDVWFDKDEIKFGDDWQRAIFCQWFQRQFAPVARCLSPAYLQSEYCE